MLLSKVALGMCVLFLVCTYAAQMTAARNGDTRRRRDLQWIMMGLSLSACAYLFHIEAKSPGSLLSVLSLVFRIGGTAFLWMAWHDHWAQQRERRAAQAAALRLEKDEAAELRLALPPVYKEAYAGLNSRAREALCAAQEEALQQRCGCVDTDHLLLGLLRVPHCAASRILERSEVSPERLAQELAGQEGGAGQSGDAGKEDMPAVFTPRARQALAMAEIEAHRFSKTFVGTEHLLLGLLLTGTGPAASALFASGMTVDAVRREVIAAGKRPTD